MRSGVRNSRDVMGESDCGSISGGTSGFNDWMTMREVDDDVAKVCPSGDIAILLMKLALSECGNRVVGAVSSRNGWICTSESGVTRMIVSPAAVKVANRAP